MTTEYGPDQLKEAREKVRSELRILDPSWAASRSGTEYSFLERSFTVSLLGEDYSVSYPQGAVKHADGSPAGGMEEILILHYLVHADGMANTGEWVAYRDLPGARYHEPAFKADVEGPLSVGLAGRLEELRTWVRDEAREVDLPGDVTAAWTVLPRVPLLIIFNEADEEFPASARVLFDITAPNYLPTEDLSALAELAVEHLMRSLGKRE
ncbi:MAG: DUF3786 domain-containing protein [Actinobacteria bacterium]|nr:DUF3786 domain-containing protein [Actinomycetota bacterium]